MSRTSQLIKLAHSTLTVIEKNRANGALLQSEGWHAFEKDLNDFGLSMGKSFAKDKWYLLRGDTTIENAYLKGDHQRMQITMDAPDKPKRKKPPQDSFSSPGARYDRSEK